MMNNIFNTNTNSNTNLTEDNYKFNNSFIGLGNLGNTCYINSVIQCLKHNIEFSNYFLKETYKEDINNTLHRFLCFEWYNLLKDLWSNKTNITVIPHKFLNVFRATCFKLKKTMFSGYSQNDAEECLNILFDIFHEGLKSIHNSITITGTPKNINDQLQLESYKIFANLVKKDGISPITKYYGGQFISQITNSFNNKVSNTYDFFSYLN